MASQLPLSDGPLTVLAFDSAALRCGWAAVSRRDDTFVLGGSGIHGLPRGEEESYESYKLRLIRYWMDVLPLMLTSWEPGLIAMEKLPAVGSGNFALAGQAELGKAVMTTITVLALQAGIPVAEIPASSVKKAVVGFASKPPKTSGGKRVKVSKVDMRNAVTEVFPSFAHRKWGDDLLADETDAVGIGLAAVGFSKKEWDRG